MQFTTTALFFLSTLAPALAAEVGATGVIKGMDGGLQGTISVVDENTLRITQYTLQDASAPALHWWGSTTENLGSGFRINNERVTTTASDQTINIALDAGYTANKFTYVGLWCERLNQNFGQAKLDQGGSASGNASTTSSGSTSATSAMSSATTKTSSYAAGALAAAAAFAALMI